MAVDDGYTKALLHMNGVDAATAFIDLSGKIWTASGNAQIDTAQFKFGGASGYFDGTGDFIGTPDHDDFNVGSEDFTIDCQIKRQATGATHGICGQGDGSSIPTISIAMSVGSDDKLRGTIYSGGTGYGLISTAVINDTDWHHVAFIREGNTLKAYIGGVVDITTVDVTGVTANNSAEDFRIGKTGTADSNPFNGWIDEFRFSKGIARWTANFTPPTREYKAKGVQMML